MSTSNWSDNWFWSFEPRFNLCLWWRSQAIDVRCNYWQSTERMLPSSVNRNDRITSTQTQPTLMSQYFSLCVSHLDAKSAPKTRCRMQNEHKNNSNNYRVHSARNYCSFNILQFYFLLFLYVSLPIRFAHAIFLLLSLCFSFGCFVNERDRRVLLSVHLLFSICSNNN